MTHPGHEDWLEVLLAGHGRIRSRVRTALLRGAIGRGEDPGEAEGAAVREGAGDLTFELDVRAEPEVLRMAEEAARLEPLRLVCEGIGTRDLGTGTPRRRLVVDPIDGTRNLSHGLRSGWVLTAVARERGDRTTLGDVDLCVQSEIPLPDRRTFEVLWAVRGGGAFRERRALGDGRLLERRRLVAPESVALERGYYVFFRYARRERVALARIEEAFFERLALRLEIDPRTLLDDHYISNAGQLHLLATRRYRFLADLRAWLGDRLGVANVTSKPYDVCCALAAEEAGCPVTAPDGSPLDPPLDTETPVSFVAYANEQARRTLEPVLHEALAAVAGEEGR